MRRTTTCPAPLTAYQRKQPPPDMLLALLPHRAAIGSSPVVSIEMRPAPGHLYWVEVEDFRGQCHTPRGRGDELPRPVSARDAVRFARRHGVDAHHLVWTADDCGEETTTNPFAE